MKKLLFLAISMAFCIIAQAADNDTIIVNNARKVTVITNDSLQKIEINGMGEDSTYHYENTIQLVDSNFVSTSKIDKKDWGFSLGGSSSGKLGITVYSKFFAGFNSALNAPSNMDVKTFSSWELWWWIAQTEYSLDKDYNNILSVGIGVDWKNYRMENDKYFSINDQNVTSINEKSNNMNINFSRIKVFSITVPVLYHFNHWKKFGFEIGPVINFNTHSSLKTRYTLDNAKCKDTSDKVNVKPVTVDFLFVLHTPSLKAYVKYCPFDLLKNNYGPKFQSLTIGLGI